ncbi:MAG: hypothetical protein K8F91_24220, partial [Candidatus Obscuribacterales bacterium]|nr:hypothetical protein [Candidatus Obscuribacterales bacterium]
IILSCLAYSLVRVSPSLLLLLVFILKRDASSTVIAAIQGPIMKWGHRIMAVIICGMGLVLALDSFYYFITDKALLVF